MNRPLKKYLLYFALAIIFIICVNTLLVSLERAMPESGIKTMADSFWYLLVTLTTVGYGDMYPLSTGGRIIGFIYVMASFGVLGFLISTITNYIYTMVEEKKLGFHGTTFENHIVFIGWNQFSHMVAEEVTLSSKKIAIVTDNKDDIEHIYNEYGKKNTFVLFADYQNFDILDKVNPNKSSEVFVSFQDDTEALIYVINFRKLYPKPEIVISIKSTDLKDTFYATGVKHVIARNELASKLVASYIFEPDVAELNYDILSSAKTDEDFDNQEYKVTEKNPYLNKDYVDAFFDVKTRYNCVLLGISKPIGNNEYKLYENPSKGMTIELNNYLILMVNKAAKDKVQTDFDTEEGRW